MTARTRMAATLVAVAALAQTPGSAAGPAASDVDLLRALHEKTMRAHRESRVEMLLEDQAAEMVIVNRGAVTRPSLEERRAGFGSYFGRTTFSEYRDLVDPMVTVSRDGTLGWVIVQVGAKGVQTEDGARKPVEFVSAWVELYEKRNGRWYGVGNVSNFRP